MKFMNWLRKIFKIHSPSKFVDEALKNDEIKLRQYAVTICDKFEDLLDTYDITIPDEDRTGDFTEARLYGGTYSDLEDAVTRILVSLAEEVRALPKSKINWTEY